MVRRILSLVVVLVVLAGSLLVLVSKTTAQAPSQSSPPTKAGGTPSGFVRLTPAQSKTLKLGSQSALQVEAARECHFSNCKKICVPGCDPPDEHGTITGCSSCYSSYLECELVCK